MELGFIFNALSFGDYICASSPYEHQSPEDRGFMRGCIPYFDFIATAGADICPVAISGMFSELINRWPPAKRTDTPSDLVQFSKLTSANILLKGTYGMGWADLRPTP